MSTITTLNSTDTGANSRTTINTNFSNLNTDKQEKVGGAVTGNVPAFGSSNVLQDSGVVAANLVTNSSLQVLTNKKLSDSTSNFVNVTDNTKVVAFGLGSMTTGSTLTIAPLQTTSRTLNIPDVGAGDSIVTNNTAATFNNKTFDTASPNTLRINGTTVNAINGTGSTLILQGSPTITTPTITKPIMNATNPTAQTYSPGAGATATLDLLLGNQHDITMPAGNITIALSNDTNNQIFTISITQDGVGSRTVTWFSTIRWASGTVPTLTTTASKRDVFIFKRTGSGTYDGFIVGQNI